MALIKSAEAGRRARAAVVFDLGDLQREAESLRAEAAREAARIVQQAQVEAARLRAEAETLGREKGERRGREEGLARGADEGRAAAFADALEQLRALAAGWTAALERWERDRADLLAAARDDVLTLALAIARRVIHRTIQHDPGVVVDQLREAVTLVARPSALTVRIHPEDRPALEAALPGLLARVKAGAHVTLVDDAAIARGGCAVGTAGGTVDASIDRQLDRIAEALVPGVPTAEASSAEGVST